MYSFPRTRLPPPPTSPKQTIKVLERLLLKACMHCHGYTVPKDLEKGKAVCFI